MPGPWHIPSMKSQIALYYSCYGSLNGTCKNEAAGRAGSLCNPGMRECKLQMQMVASRLFAELPFVLLQACCAPCTHTKNMIRNSGATLALRYTGFHIARVFPDLAWGYFCQVILLTRSCWNGS